MRQADIGHYGLCDAEQMNLCLDYDGIMDARCTTVLYSISIMYYAIITALVNPS